MLLLSFIRSSFVRSFIHSFVRSFVWVKQNREPNHVVDSAVQRSCWDDATVRACAHIFGDDVKRNEDKQDEDEQFEASDDDERIEDEENRTRRVRRASRAAKRREGIDPDERRGASPRQSQSALRVFRFRRRRYDGGKGKHG